jgi:hypothetical protein
MSVLAIALESFVDSKINCPNPKFYLECAIEMMCDLFRQYIHMSIDGAALLLHRETRNEIIKGKRKRV